MPHAPLPTRKLGKDGPEVPAMGFGLMALSGMAYGLAGSDEDRFALLDRALELGETFWDTANIYGDNETMLGEWFKRTGKRDQIFIASKFGIKMTRYSFGGSDSSAEYCKQACEESLQKMGIDCIDLYYVHRVDTEVPIEVTMRALVELQKEGKIKHIGLSEVSSTTLRRAHKIAPIACVQMEFSPFVLDIEGEKSTNILKTCRELGVAVVCYSPLGRGLLTGAFTTKESVNGERDMRGKMFPRFSEEYLPANTKLVNELKAMAEKKGCSVSQLVIAWTLKQGNDLIPIPGTKKIKNLEENLGALDVRISDEEEAEIRKFVESADVLGYRSVPQGEALAYADTKEEA